MRKMFIFFWFSCSAFCVHAINEITDPFAEPAIMSCHEWSEHLREQLTGWHFKGIVHSEQKEERSYRQIWLMNDNQHWLEILAPIVPLELHPWQMQSITSGTIIWQAKLPEYCQSPLLIAMGLGEK